MQSSVRCVVQDLTQTPPSAGSILLYYARVHSWRYYSSCGDVISTCKYYFHLEMFFPPGDFSSIWRCHFHLNISFPYGKCHFRSNISFPSGDAISTRMFHCHLNLPFPSGDAVSTRIFHFHFNLSFPSGDMLRYLEKKFFHPDIFFLCPRSHIPFSFEHGAELHDEHL